MPDETKTDAPEIPAFNPEPVERNGIVKMLTPMRIVKGDREGQPYLAPQFDDTNDLVKEITWWGKGLIKSIVDSFAKKEAQNIWFDESNIDESGQFLLGKVLSEMKDLTGTSMKLSEIADRLEEVQAIMSQLFRSNKWRDTSDPEGCKACQDKMKEYDDYYLSLRAMQAKRQKKKNADKASDPAIAEVK